jgi:hypothetical protein
MIADPVVRYLLMAAVLLLLLVVWGCFRAHFHGTESLRTFIARLRGWSGRSEDRK